MIDNATFEVKDKAKKIERWVRNTLSGASEIEVKVKEATNNDKWGPTGKQMQEIAAATHNFENFDAIMKTIWVRLNDNGKYWRHVYKGLLLMEYLIKNGAEQVVRSCQSNSRQIQTLTKFQHVTEKGKDEGENIRNRARQIVELLSDDERVREERKKATEVRRRFEQSMSSEGGLGGSEDYGNYSRGGSNYGGDSYGGNNRSTGGGYRDNSRTNNTSNNDDDDEKYNYDSDEDTNNRNDDSRPTNNVTPTTNTKTGEKKPRPPSTELQKNQTTTTTTTTTQTNQPSLIELFSTPTTTTNTNTGFNSFQTGGNTGFNSFQTGGNTGFGFQGGNTTTTNTGFGSFQSGGTTTNTGFGSFQGGNTTNNTGFGSFQSGGTTTTNNTGFGSFQSGGTTTTTNNTGFGSFQTGNSGFGNFQSGNNDDFDSFNPRGSTTQNSFANFDNPNQQQESQTEKKFEYSNLVNLTNLVEDPNDNRNNTQEKKTLGQTLQQKQTNSKPVLSGGLNTNTGLTPTPLNPLTTNVNLTFQTQQPVLQIQNLSLQQIQQLTPLQIQQLNPQQLQQLQYQYQLLLQLQQQQNQLGGRGF